MQRSRPITNTVRFGAFELDGDAGELRRDGVKVRLQEQPLQILQILLAQQGKVVTREQLREKIWPSDTFVDFDHGINNAIKRLREALGDTADTPRFIETLPRRGYRFVGGQITQRSTEGFFRSLAVLPLENLSGDPEQEYFAEGMTDALIAALAKISALRVISRTTVLCYKGKRQPLPAIARELGVDAIIEGSVLRSGNRARISVQLIEASTDSHIWAESYERDLRDVLTLQSEVARSIAREIQIKLTPQEQALLTSSRVVDPDAYEAYLKGRYHWARRSGEGLQLAARYFEQAVAKDPNYAAAYAGLADCANSGGWWCIFPPKQGCGKARSLAEQALSMDGSLAEAHSSLAFSLLFHDFDFLNAEREFCVALDLGPENANIMQWHAISLGMMGRFDESIAEILRAVQIDPLSAIMSTLAGMLFFYARRYDESIEMCEKVLELAPHFYLAHWAKSVSLIEQRQHEVAVSEIEGVVRETKRMPFFLQVLGYCYAKAGKREEALSIIEELRDLAERRYIPSYWPAIIYAGLSERHHAFQLLDAAYREHEPWMVLTKYWPLLDSLRSDPRMDDLLRRMNFPD